MLSTRAPGISSDKKPLAPYVYTAEQIPLVWEELEPLIEKSVKESYGMVSLRQIYNLLIADKATAFAMIRDGRVETILVITINQYATYRSALVIACAGENLAEAWQFHDIIGNWALTQGVVEFEAWARPVMERLLQDLGWKRKVSIMTFNLREKLQ